MRRPRKPTPQQRVEAPPRPAEGATFDELAAVETSAGDDLALEAAGFSEVLTFVFTSWERNSGGPDRQRLRK